MYAPLLLVNANDNFQRKGCLAGSSYWASSASTRHTTALLDQKCGVGEEEIGRVVMKQVSFGRPDGDAGGFDFAQHIK